LTEITNATTSSCGICSALIRRLGIRSPTRLPSRHADSLINTLAVSPHTPSELTKKTSNAGCLIINKLLLIITHCLKRRLKGNYRQIMGKIHMKLRLSVALIIIGVVSFVEAHEGPVRSLPSVPKYVAVRITKTEANYESLFADVNGVRMHYLKSGNGKTPLVLIHGFGDDA